MDAANELRGSPIIGYAIPTGHFPFIGQPGMIVDVVRKVPGEKLSRGGGSSLGSLQQIFKLFIFRNQCISSLSELLISDDVA